MKHPTRRQLQGITRDETDTQCPNCESSNMTDHGRNCTDCDWSLPTNLSTTTITGDHAPFEKCDHCGQGMRVGPCEDCLITEGLESDETNVEVVEEDDCVVIDNTDSTQATLDELLDESDIIDGDDDAEVLAD